MEMEWIVFTSLLLFTFFGFHHGVMARKPKMIPEGGVMMIQEGQTFEIKCQGDESLQFSIQNIPETDEFEKSSSYDRKTGWHTFTFTDTTHENTRWYACAEDGIAIDNDEQTINRSSNDISWIYVYVESSSPFADNAFTVRSSAVGKTFVIPCRPTSPNLEIKVQKDNKDLDLSTIPYDPKIGFQLHLVNISLSGVYTCHVNKNEPSDEEPMYRLSVNANTSCEIPLIDQMTTKRVVQGTNHTLICSVSASQDIISNLSWKGPHKVPDDRLKYSQNILKSVQTDGQIKWTAELTIINVEMGDAGEYSCEADGGCTATSVSEKIDILGELSPFIHIEVEGGIDGLIQADEGQNATWKVKIDTNPRTSNRTWLKPDLSEVTGPGTKYSDSQTERLWRFFEIFNVDIHDSGNYKIIIKTAAGVNSTVLRLLVRTKPVVEILDHRQYYVPKTNAIFECESTASPLSNITWQYLGYPNFPLTLKYENGEINNVSVQVSKHEPFKIVSSLNITINMVGDLICKSCNEVNCSARTERIMVSDTGEPFSVEVSPAIVTEGDNINLTCSASVYNYTDDITWTGDRYEEPATENERIAVNRVETNLAHQSILQIQDIDKSYSGNYSCTTLNMKSRKNETKIYNLIVDDASTPRIIRGNMKNSSHTVNLTDDKGYRLECVTYGRPIPVVTWLKDGDARFINNTRFSIEKNNTVLRIKLFREDDGGRYSCRAQNRLGVVEHYTDIIIEGLATQSIIIWISLVCILIVIIVIIIVYMGIRVHRERALRKELCEAGLTHFVDGAVECLNPDLPIDDQAELLPYDKKWEFPPDMLKIGKQLGSGAFGVVMKAEARGIITEGETTTVAVKMVRSTAEPSYMKALASELKIMIHMGQHLNVVNLLGACTNDILTKRKLYVIVEYCRFGNLHNYLQRHRSSFIDQIDPVTQKIDLSIGMDRLARSESIGSQNRLKYADLSFCRSFSVSSAGSNNGVEQLDYRALSEFGDISMSPDGGVLSNNSVQPGWRSNYRGDYKDQNLKPICTQDLLCWAWQVARGMEYLSSRNVLHGDLAARNILLADDNIVKICDFGLAKNMYKDNNYKKKGDGPLPIKWMAIESIRDRIYSTQSDVWSFGIVLWEFFTLAQTPYPGMEAETQYDRLIEGYRMPKPIYATDEIYEDIVKDCWKAKPSLRPTFTSLVDKIGILLNDSIRLYYCELDTPYTEMNSAKLQDGQNDYLTMMSAPNDNSLDPMSDSQPGTEYLAMSPVNKTAEPGIFSPRPDLNESHFEFPPTVNNTTSNSDTDECVESVPMLKSEDPYLVPVDVHQRRADFAKQGKTQTAVDNDYCNMPKNRNPSIVESNDQSPDIMKISDQNDEKTKLQNNHKNDSVIPMIYSGTDNYVNMPQRNTDRPKNTTDSFSNPSYVVMSKLEDNSQFV